MLVTVYVTLIIAGRRALEENDRGLIATPRTIRAAVARELEILGVNGFGEPIETELTA